MVNPTGRSAQMVVSVCLGLLELFPALSMALVSLIGIFLVAKATAGSHSAKLMAIIVRHRPAALSPARAFPLKNQAP